MSQILPKMVTFNTQQEFISKSSDRSKIESY